MKRKRYGSWSASLAVAGLMLVLVATGCASPDNFDSRLRDIAGGDAFSFAGWEFQAMLHEVGQVASSIAGETVSEPLAEIATVLDYFSARRRLATLDDELAEISTDDQTTLLQDEIERLEQRRAALQATVERIIEEQVRDTLRREGIYHPAQTVANWTVVFPPVNVRLDEPLHLLVVSPRDRIESLREIILDHSLTVATMEKIEAAADDLGVSSLVIELGGLGVTYPAFVTNTAGLRFTLETVAEEWLHQYLAFTPLGFRYLLDVAGIRRDYEIATINETVVGIVSEEIAALVYERYYDGDDAPRDELAEGEFDFDGEMRRIRLTVDAYLDDGKIDEAETYMARQRDFLAANGYYIRKLNQAYFAFHGTYADEPTSVSPIGRELRVLRTKSRSLSDFLTTAAKIESRDGLRTLLAE